MDISPVALYQALCEDLSRSSTVKGWPSLAVEDCDISSFDSDIDLGYIASLRLLKSIVKKFEPVEPDVSLADKAIALFKQMNTRCGEYMLPSDDWGRELISTMKTILDRELSEVPDWKSLLERMAPGPGSAVGSRGRNSYFEKLFLNPLTTTSPELYTEYQLFLSQHPLWIRSENFRRIFHNKGRAVKIVNATRLSTVRKNSEIDRTTESQASLDMLFQKALAGWLLEKLRIHYSFSEKIQPSRNRRMARVGSEDGSLATIDLTSASDLNSLRLGEAILPPCLFAAICDARSPAVQIAKEVVPLHMISAMGNGFTFVLMTYIFSVMLKAVCYMKGVKFTKFSHEKFGVFGDDIVCPTALYPDVIRALKALGHEPNLEKSYSEGNFRESCGVDCFAGVNVRGVYCKKLRTRQDRFSLVNRLNRWSARWKLPLSKTVALLLPSHWRSTIVPADEGDDAGIKAPYYLRKEKVLGSPWYFAYEPVKRLVIIEGKDGLRKDYENPDGLLLSATLGWVQSLGRTSITEENLRKPVRSMAFVSRRPRTGQRAHYQRIRKFTSSIWACDADFAVHGVCYADWESYVTINLTS